MITRIDRLARSMKDLQDIVRELKTKGAALKATEQPVDTGSAAGKAFLDMPGVFAEFETNLRKERQLEGIAAAKAKGNVTLAVKPTSTPARCANCLKWMGRFASRRSRLSLSVYRVLGTSASRVIDGKPLTARISQGANGA